MTLSELAKDVIVPGIAIVYTVVKVLKDLKAAGNAETKRALVSQVMIEKLVEEKEAQWKQQVDFLQEQLDNCLDSSRPQRPDS